MIPASCRAVTGFCSLASSAANASINKPFEKSKKSEKIDKKEKLNLKKAGRCLVFWVKKETFKYFF
jgi:hypothetical protein